MTTTNYKEPKFELRSEPNYRDSDGDPITIINLVDILKPLTIPETAEFEEDTEMVYTKNPYIYKAEIMFSELCDLKVDFKSVKDAYRWIISELKIYGDCDAWFIWKKTD